MADKEPRRRKKRKDSQSRKDDIRSEDSSFISTKFESKESDQEAEEEVIVPSHHPSVFAKFVFILLFSFLIVAMGLIFISLRGVSRSETEIFDDHHVEELESHSEVIVDHHELEAEDSLFSETIESYIPGIGSILSFGSKPLEEDAAVSSKQDDEESLAEPSQEDASTSSSVHESLSSNQEDITEDPEDIYSADHIIESQDEFTTPVYEDNSQELHDDVKEHVVMEDVTEQPATQAFEDSMPETTTHSTVLADEHTTESKRTSQAEDQITEENFDAMSDDKVSFYEKASITTPDDYAIRDQLDELDDSLEKLPEKALKKCEDLMKLHTDSPRLLYIKAKALDKMAEVQRSNKHLEQAIATYQKVMECKDVPEQLYLLAGTRAAERSRFRGFTGKSLVLLSEMMDKFPLNIDIKNQVAVGYMYIGRNDKAKNVLREVLRLSPGSGVAKVHLGFILKMEEGAHAEAARLMAEGIATGEEGVRDGRFYYHLGDALHRTGRTDEALQVYEDAAKLGLFLSPYQRSLYNVKGLTGKPWWDPQKSVYAPDFKILERNWLSIRDEALALMNDKHSSFLPESEGLQDTGDWKQFELFMRGHKKEENCRRAPKTCSLIAQISNAANCKRGQVKFSVMQPSTHVWAHTGPTNTRLRAHLGLKVPEGASIRVVNETRVWKEGKILLFDDSFEHEVWHNGTEPRVVLIVDFWHPELTAYHKKTLTPI